jgi:GLPGLI family protein
MKYALALLFSALTAALFGQSKSESNSDLVITYQLNYKRLVSSEQLKSTRTVLVVNKSGSFFSFEGMIELNKLRKEKDLSISDILAYQPPFYLVIRKEKGISAHYESIVDDYYIINEPISLRWELVNQDSLIGKVKCKKAISNYGGRKWIAWYNPEIAVSSGPYVFDGLPGLIYKISDSENIFNFVIAEIKSQKFEMDTNLGNYFINSEQKPFETISRADFLKIRTKLSQMSIDEQMAYMNRGMQEREKLVITTVNGEAVRTNVPVKKKNFFEKDE